MSQGLSATTIQFLNLLNRNNNRDWFHANKDSYIVAQQDMIDFVQNLIDRMGQWDNNIQKLEAKKTLFRIYRDTRFSKDPRPYKTNFGARFGIHKGSQSAGYYLHIEPGKSFLAGGLYQPENSILKKIRNEIVYDPQAFLSIIEAEKFRQNFRGLSVENKLKRIPNDFDKNHPMSEYLKLKSYIVSHPIADSLLLSDNSYNYISEVFQAISPLNNFLNQIMDTE